MNDEWRQTRGNNKCGPGRQGPSYAGVPHQTHTHTQNHTGKWVDQGKGRITWERHAVSNAVSTNLLVESRKWFCFQYLHPAEETWPKPHNLHRLRSPWFFPSQASHSQGCSPAASSTPTQPSNVTNHHRSLNHHTGAEITLYPWYTRHTRLSLHISLHDNVMDK